MACKLFSKISCSVIIILFYACLCHTAFDGGLLSDRKMVDYINKNAGWKAALPKRKVSNRHGKVEVNIPADIDEGVPYGDASTLMRTEDLPKHFDLRDIWKNCTSVADIRDQSECNSCYAVAGAAALSDRFCIQSGGRHNVLLSALDLLSCCATCGATNNDGCEGGSEMGVWTYFTEHGIVTGGGYHSDVGCRPYPFPPCSGLSTMAVTARCQDASVFKAPACRHQCRAGHEVPYWQDKHFAEYFYAAGQNSTDIQKEIYLRGTVHSGMDMHADFQLYKGGIYTLSGGSNSKSLGHHSVRLIGWGEENGVDYWIAANSWGYTFGENGTFRIRRGTDEVHIEFFAIAGKPLFKTKAALEYAKPHVPNHGEQASISFYSVVVFVVISCYLIEVIRK